MRSLTLEATNQKNIISSGNKTVTVTDTMDGGDDNNQGSKQIKT